MQGCGYQEEGLVGSTLKTGYPIFYPGFHVLSFGGLHFSGDILKKVAWEVIFFRCYICELVFNLSSSLNEGFSLEFQVESIFLRNCERFILHHVVSRVFIGKSDAIVNVYCCVLPVFVFLKLLDVSLYPCILEFHTVCGSFFLLHAFVYCPGYAMGSFNLKTQALQFLKFSFIRNKVFYLLVIFSVISLWGHICYVVNLY